MAREIILYNIKKNIAEAEYAKYCREEKGPFIESLPSCKRFTAVRIKLSKQGDIPFDYAGVVETTSKTEWLHDTASRVFQEFYQRWLAKVDDFLILIGDEIYTSNGEAHDQER